MAGNIEIKGNVSIDELATVKNLSVTDEATFGAEDNVIINTDGITFNGKKVLVEGQGGGLGVGGDKAIDITYKVSTVYSTMISTYEKGRAYLQSDYVPSSLVGASGIRYYAQYGAEYTISEANIYEQNSDGITYKIDEAFVFIAFTTNYKPSLVTEKFPQKGIYFSYYDDGDPYYVYTLTRADDFVGINGKYVDLSGNDDFENLKNGDLQLRVYSTGAEVKNVVNKSDSIGTVNCTWESHNVIMHRCLGGTFPRSYFVKGKVLVSGTYVTDEELVIGESYNSNDNGQTYKIDSQSGTTFVVNSYGNYVDSTLGVTFTDNGIYLGEIPNDFDHPTVTQVSFYYTPKTALKEVVDKLKIIDYNENDPDNGKPCIINKPCYIYHGLHDIDSKAIVVSNDFLSYETFVGLATIVPPSLDELQNYSVYVDFLGKNSTSASSVFYDLKDFNVNEISGGYKLWASAPSSVLSAPAVNVYIINDYELANSGIGFGGSGFPSNGLYTCYVYNDTQEDDVYVTYSSEVKKIIMPTYKKLDNQFLDLPNNKDFKELKEKVENIGSDESGVYTLLNGEKNVSSIGTPIIVHTVDVLPEVGEEWADSDTNPTRTVWYFLTTESVVYMYISGAWKTASDIGFVHKVVASPEEATEADTLYFVAIPKSGGKLYRHTLALNGTTTFIDGEVTIFLMTELYNYSASEITDPMSLFRGIFIPISGGMVMVETHAFPILAAALHTETEETNLLIMITNVVHEIASISVSPADIPNFTLTDIVTEV